MSLTLTSRTKDEIRAATVDPTFAGRVTLAAYAGTAGGDGHLGHLDPESGSTHTHGGKLAIDLPTGQAVRIGPGGVAQIRVRDLVEGPTPGDNFQLTLQFENAPDKIVTVAIEDA